MIFLGNLIWAIKFLILWSTFNMVGTYVSFYNLTMYTMYVHQLKINLLKKTWLMYSLFIYNKIKL